jgi:hypothetical protein
MAMRAVVLGLSFLLSSAAFGGDTEFNRIVKSIETRYGTERTHIPLMGVANFFVKVRHLAGASGLKLAVFDDLSAPPSPAEIKDLDQFMDSLASGSLRPLIRVHSRRGEESTYILAGPAGKSTKMLIATFESHEATVIQVSVDTKLLLQAISDPEHAGETVGVKRRD